MANSNIHHTHVKQAEKIGVILEPAELGVKAVWPSRGVHIHGPNAKEALARIKAKQAEIFKQEQDDDEEERAPIEEYPGEVTDPGETSGPNSGRAFKEDNPLTIDGVPTNGRMAHQKGFAVVDNPFTGEQEYESAVWEEEWEDSAAEALDEKPEEEAPEKPGSVVKTKYRAIYAERGHPTHCGDELAVKLNNLVLDGSHCNIEYFKMILDANGVDMSKYNTTNNGWQGRYRMTGRNKLAKVVHSNGGVLKLPNGDELRMSQEWIQSQRFK